ncbi:Bro1p [Sugiyamaella lignohabitans]|uniref:BRO domain-containing protein 1 n=1 Tax=Sugiyamaella lignohabitans TaxID=796027 RepID=A0A167FJ23_9ASCO|nr:Bro1p [Sugiyamaella lignohabitans]ANB15366.1 Bro1p [Sugiyamaella lignohabitans]
MKDTALIALPLKETSETDWTGPLRQYITGIYGTADVYNEDITALNRLRQDVRGCASDATGRDIIYRYYGQLELLELRIPVNDHGCRLSFTWYDSFTHTPITQHSLAFEKASLLYNLASVNSHIGADSDDVKVSYAAFQAASGIYAFILENFLHAPSSDLVQDTVKALSKLMVGQAQEVLTLKQIHDSAAKPSTVAKLAKGTSNMYKSAGEALASVHTSKSWGEKSWHLLSQLKSKYYLAISYDYQARHLEATDKYGQALAYLNIAVESFREVVKQAVPLHSQYSDFVDTIKAYQETAELNLKRLDKDNDFIYHEHIPNAATLAEISGMEAAKPTPMNQLYKENKDISQIIGKELFEKLIPLSVHEKSSLYSEEKASLLRKEGEAVEVAEEEMASALEFLDLPASLRILQSNSDIEAGADQDLPSNVQSWASEISGSASITFANLESKRNTVYNTIKKAESLINEEENQWRTAKSQYGDSFNQTSSISLSSAISSDIHRIKESLSNGAVSDQLVQKLLNSGNVRQDIEKLRSGPYGQELMEAFTISAPSTNPQSAGSIPNLLDLDIVDERDDVASLVAQTDDLLNRLHKVSQERKTLFKDFKQRVHNDDISSLLILNSKVPNIEETLFKTELEKFQPFRTRLEATIHHQKVLLKEITSTWKKVLSNESVKQKTKSRESIKVQRLAMIDRFKLAYNSWKAAQDGMSKGSEFYDDLLSRSLGILQNAQQFHQNRGEERARLLSAARSAHNAATQDQLRQQLADFSIAPRPHESNPPSRGDFSIPSMTNAPTLPPKPNSVHSSFSGPSHDSFSNPGGSYLQSSQPLPPPPQSQLDSREYKPPSHFNSPAPAPYTVPSAYTPALYSQPESQPPVPSQYQTQSSYPQNFNSPTYSYQRQNSNNGYGQ